MYNFSRFVVVAALVVSVVACGDATSPATPAAQSKTTPAQATPAAAPDPVDFLEKSIAKDPLYTQAGKVVDGLMTNDGKGGYLLHGPYVPFAAGDYTVAIKGQIIELPAGQHVRLDAVTAKGKKWLNQIEVKETGGLPTFDFTLPEAVTDLEIRVFVPAGSKVAVESYQVTRKL